MFITSQVEAGERLDKVVRRRLGAAFSRARVQKLIAAGAVKVNGSSRDADYRVKEKDEVKIQTAEVRSQNEEQAGPNPDARIPCEILYDDLDIAVVWKPVGVATHPGAGHFDDTLVSGLKARLDRLASYGAPLRPGIVHRLDMDTSGLLVVAKSDEAYLRLVAMIKAREIHRHYLALCWGWIKENGQWLAEGGRKRIGFIKDGTGTISVPIGRHPVERKKMSAAARHAREAVTHFRILEHFRPTPSETRIALFTLVEATLDTGRTHQVRVHLKEIGHPLVGDPLYSSRKPLNALTAENPELAARIRALPGQALVAHRLEFPHPITERSLRLECAPPALMADLLRFLQERTSNS